MAEHFRDNGVDPAEHELLHAAVSCTSGTISFLVGQPSSSYGQSISGRASTPGRGTNRAPADTQAMANLVSMEVPATPLADILTRHERVDLLDCDIQGHEAEVFACSMDSLTQRVKRVHVGTHSAEIEERLRKLFGEAGWICLGDYAGGGVRATPFGLISFEDGVQTWVNPRLA
jgi:FkbM family methyltransferase